MIYFILQFKTSVILITQFLALKYRTPNIKYPNTVYPKTMADPVLC